MAGQEVGMLGLTSRVDGLAGQVSTKICMPPSKHTMKKMEDKVEG